MAAHPLKISSFIPRHIHQHQYLAMLLLHKQLMDMALKQAHQHTVVPEVSIQASALLPASVGGWASKVV
jgi:hypothetical protein